MRLHAFGLTFRPVSEKATQSFRLLIGKSLHNKVRLTRKFRIKPFCTFPVPHSILEVHRIPFILDRGTLPARTWILLIRHCNPPFPRLHPDNPGTRPDLNSWILLIPSINPPFPRRHPDNPGTRPDHKSWILLIKSINLPFPRHHPNNPSTHPDLKSWILLISSINPPFPRCHPDIPRQHPKSIY